MIEYTEQETAKIPPSLRGLMQDYGLSFLNALEVLDLGPIKGPFETLEIYADDEVFPVLGKDVNGRVYANPIKTRPTAWTVFFDGECGYVQVLDRILASRVDYDFLQEFKL